MRYENHIGEQKHGKERDDKIERVKTNKKKTCYWQATKDWKIAIEIEYFVVHSNKRERKKSMKKS